VRRPLGGGTMSLLGVMSAEEPASEH
jgi:hypothetical protein